MTFIIDIIKGIFVGVANIIPGVSGGTMAVSMGVYDKLVGAINNLTKEFKKSFFKLLPLIIGMVGGIGLFSFIIPGCLENYTFQTTMCFCGLVIGGIPELIKDTQTSFTENKKKMNPMHIMIFLLFVALAVFMAISNGSSEGADSIEVSAPNILKLLLFGIIAAATMVVPGISGSLILMMLGYYSGIIGTISAFLSAIKALDGGAIGHCLAILGPFGIGCVLGILLISKLITWLFKRFKTYTYCGILGLVMASPFAIFYKTNEEYTLNFSVVSIIVGVVLFVAACGFTYIFGLKTKKSEAPSEEAKEE